MSRIANNPIKVPLNVSFENNGSQVNITGPLGKQTFVLPNNVTLDYSNDDVAIRYDADNKEANMMAGTVRAIINNHVLGVSKGFEKKLQLVGVGYRASIKGTSLNLTLGFSHPIEFHIPEGITIETPTQTEIVVKGSDKQQVGQVSANIRKYREPEPYKGKGIRYSDERIIRKEAKKK